MNQTFVQFTTNSDTYTYYMNLGDKIDGFISEKKFNKFVKSIRKEIEQRKSIKILNRENFIDELMLVIYVDSSQIEDLKDPIYNKFKWHFDDVLLFDRFEDYSNICDQLQIA